MALTRLAFLREFATQFQQTGAVTPSSKVLARRMVLALQPGDNFVVELGPGTGVFTQELLRSGVAPEKLLLVEFNEKFVMALRRRFPGVNIVHGDAADLAAILETTGTSKVKRVISGLPFRSLPAEACDAIVRALGQCLAPKGQLVQFTYALRAPLGELQAAAAGLSAQHIGFVASNIPPAHLWRYTKHG